MINPDDPATRYPTFGVGHSTPLSGRPRYILFGVSFILMKNFIGFL